MIRLTDRPDMTLDVYYGRKTTKQQIYHVKHITLSKIKRESPLVSLFRSLNPLYRYIDISNTGTFCDKNDIS